MATGSMDPEVVRARLADLVRNGATLEAEGLPFPTSQVQEAVERALANESPAEAVVVLKRVETLYQKTAQDWTWVRELLRRADELRAIAEAIGVDLEHLDSRVGNARKRLKSQPLSAGSLERAAASASLALAVLNETIPKFCVQEAQQLGVSIRRARNRGEDVTEATHAFSRMLQAVQDDHLPIAAQRLVELRKAVVRIPRAPVLPPISPNEEEEILLEARNLARRLQRIKTKARDAHTAARLMTQVKAALSEDRRYGTPEEEIEELWKEVDRLTQERKEAIGTPTPSTEGLTTPEPALVPVETEPIGEMVGDERPPLGGYAYPPPETRHPGSPEEPEPEESLAAVREPSESSEDGIYSRSTSRGRMRGRSQGRP